MSFTKILEQLSESEAGIEILRARMPLWLANTVEYPKDGLFIHLVRVSGSEWNN